jgi:type IV pilus assembly protein PilO
MSNGIGFRERFLSPLGLHMAGFSLLAIATLLLGIRVILDWQATSSSNVDAIAAEQLQLKMLEVQTSPLRGLDKKVDLSREQIDQFYSKRIPPSYSAILEQLGALKSKGTVMLSRVGYTQAKGSGDLIEIRMDAGLSGDYISIMRFINGLERSQTFFVIRAMSLSGQQSGTVNLRLQFSTWLRPADAAASGIQVDGESDSPSGSQPAPDDAGPGVAALDSKSATKAGVGE